MNAFLLSVHVLAAILAVGPVAVAASMFPGVARLADDNPKKAATLQILHRTTRVYAVIGILVPVFGLATGARIGVLGDAWLIVSLVLTVAAAGILLAFVLPGQKRVVDALGARPAGDGPAGNADRNFQSALGGGRRFDDLPPGLDDRSGIVSPRKILEIIGVVELVTLVLMLINLATVHQPQVS